ncbi:Phosphoglucan phosphatase LSF2, chloroplastic [Porphyridium purpureum]|uniref:Phosphoglucan phosphatase LSF2, chloroplastic n=1 Tax=Porphyridium purpureum TaxID=35688 RepID=A0A5J4ZAZ5_PORPP|nr:Phosphoglucan phosphatase LSF2, chloroplastic [Porphyridium purpureum]|eukprot:POR1528..scf295_1
MTQKLLRSRAGRARSRIRALQSVRPASSWGCGSSGTRCARGTMQAIKKWWAGPGSWDGWWSVFRRWSAPERGEEEYHDVFERPAWSGKDKQRVRAALESHLQETARVRAANESKDPRRSVLNSDDDHSESQERATVLFGMCMVDVQEFSAEVEVYIVGGCAELGNWDMKNGLRLRAVEGGIFAGGCGMAVTRSKDVEYKYVLKQRKTPPDTGDSYTVWNWEDLPGNGNRILAKSDYIVFDIDPPVFFAQRRGTLQFRMLYDLNAPECLCITGDPSELGAWADPGPRQMELSSQLEPLPQGLGEGLGRFWTISIPRPAARTFSYRYIVRNTSSGAERWEREPNRTFRPLLSLLVEDDQKDESESGFVSPFFKVTDVNFVGGLDFDRIPPDMFLGPYPQSADDIQKMKDAGVRGVVNVQTDGDMQCRKVIWTDMLNLYAEAGIHAVRVPIEDFNPESLTVNLAQAAQALADLHRDGYAPVYVHCTAGMSRAAATVITYLVVHLKMFSSVQDAYDHVKKHRSVIAPNMQVVRDVVAPLQETTAQ